MVTQIQTLKISNFLRGDYPSFRIYHDRDRKAGLNLRNGEIRLLIVGTTGITKMVPYLRNLPLQTVR